MMKLRKLSANVRGSVSSILNIRSASQTTTSLAFSHRSSSMYALPKSVIVPPPTSLAIDLTSSIKITSNF